MPTYEYKCEKCDYVFEKFHGINDNPVMKCKKCRKKPIRLISAGQPPIFKGRLNKNWHPSAISDMGEPDGSSGF